MDTMIATRLTWVEKSALIATGAAAAFNILLWQLGLTLNSAGPHMSGIDPVAVLRVLFAMLGFAAFDLVLVALVVHAIAYGVAWHSLLAASGAALLSGLIALETAAVIVAPALHAAPAVTLLLFVLHLMFSRSGTATTLRSAVAVPQMAPLIAQHFAVCPQLPRTVVDFITARAAELPGLSVTQLAAELRTSADTIRRAMTKPEVIEAAEPNR